MTTSFGAHDGNLVAQVGNSTSQINKSRIYPAWDAIERIPFRLRGVAGSGKTQVLASLGR